jgi:hypothetical protein
MVAFVAVGHHQPLANRSRYDHRLLNFDERVGHRADPPVSAVELCERFLRGTRARVRGQLLYVGKHSGAMPTARLDSYACGENWTGV